MEVAPTSWTSRAEAAIRTLRDVEGVSIQAEDDDIREIHILTTANRPAKQIVRDVQTLLLTRFNRTIDHRVVSVAFARPPGADGQRLTQVSAAPPRIRFVSANLYVSGQRVQAQVELRWRGLLRLGSAAGWSTRERAHRLIAAATMAAVQEYLADPIALNLEEVERVRVGGREIVVVSVNLLAHREEKILAGCCTVGHDCQQAVVLATLGALNRVVEGLAMREPDENIFLRPTSTKEESEAN